VFSIAVNNDILLKHNGKQWKRTKEEYMVKLVAVDLDGTFLNSKRQVSKQNIETIKQLQKMGVKFVTNSGRDYHGVKVVIDHTQIKCDYICMNGGAVFNNEGELLKSCHMEKEVVQDILNSVDQNEYFIDINTNKGTCVTISKEEAEDFLRGWMSCYNNGDMTNIDPDEIERDIKRIKESITYVNDIDEIFEKGYLVCKVSISHRDTEKISKLRRKFSENSNLSVASSFDTNIEITDKNANKGVALEAYAKEHNIKMDEVMAFGDSLNDYSMLSKDFGYTVAMGNAIDKIKKTAKYITKTNDEDGVAYFVKEVMPMLQ
jgi:Cof subfamily protein (haloacid dehalogenase superfamily)